MGRISLQQYEEQERRKNAPYLKKRKNSGKRAENALKNRGKKSKAKDLIFGKKLVRVWDPKIEENKETMQVLSRLKRYPDIFPYVAIMPDYHPGENSINGSVIPTRNTLYVNAIGGDIGCGMALLRIPLKAGDVSGKLNEIYEKIYEKVPSGRRFNVVFDESLEENQLFNEDLEILTNKNRKRAMQQMATSSFGTLSWKATYASSRIFLLFSSEYLTPKSICFR